MRKATLILSTALAIAATGLTAQASTGPIAGPAEAGRAPSELTQIAYSKIIRVGPRSNSTNPWHCRVTAYGNVYYSEGITEQATRERLYAHTNEWGYCRKERRTYL